ncbi:MAG: NADH-quinone oxidoreductase subunit C [Spirochaetaceae bacterium]|nr:NADH-quinone oxidoreductase subunit C [Myxococcales bacterium]MCB9723701.1 NADH-quinone oxidoreductase subunit C [Spirochaetaceae bacterium]HPG28519.1 NADH-quinone oxidoreductase subunit C [Myxococcota bacterium]
MSERLEGEALRAWLVAFGAEVDRAADGLCVRITVDRARSLLRALREEPALSMTRLVDLTAIDRGVGEARFELVYRLARSADGERVRVVVPLAEAEPPPESVVSLWPAADWLEREIFDLFGLSFRSHPGLRRLLLPQSFGGAPLRKDPGQRDATAPDSAKVAAGGGPS